MKLNEFIFFDSNDCLREKCSNEDLLKEIIRKFKIEIDALTEVSITDKTFLYGNIGNLYRIAGKQYMAIESLQKAIRLGGNKQINNVIRLGEALKYDGQHEKALIKFDEAIKLSTSHSSSALLDFAFQHKGKCLLEMGQLSSALDYFQKAMKIRMEKGDQSLIDSTQKAIDFTRLHGGV